MLECMRMAMLGFAPQPTRQGVRTTAAAPDNSPTKVSPCLERLLRIVYATPCGHRTGAKVANSPDQRIKEDMPLPEDPSHVFQGGLLAIAVLACMYIAKEALLPIVLAFFLKLLVQPAMNVLKRLRVPRVLAALLALALLLGVIVGLVDLLSSPASSWAQRLPQGLPRLQERVRFISQPLESMTRLFKHAQSAMVGGGSQSAPHNGTDIQQLLLSTAHHFA